MDTLKILKFPKLSRKRFWEIPKLNESEGLRNKLSKSGGFKRSSNSFVSQKWDFKRSSNSMNTIEYTRKTHQKVVDECKVDLERFNNSSNRWRLGFWIRIFSLFVLSSSWTISYSTIHVNKFFFFADLIQITWDLQKNKRR